MEFCDPQNIKIVKNNGSHCLLAQPTCTDPTGHLGVLLSRWRGLLRHLDATCPITAVLKNSFGRHGELLPKVPCLLFLMLPLQEGWKSHRGPVTQPVVTKDKAWMGWRNKKSRWP